jgi:hypothetical protein
MLNAGVCRGRRLSVVGSESRQKPADRKVDKALQLLRPLPTSLLKIVAKDKRKIIRRPNGSLAFSEAFWPYLNSAGAWFLDQAVRELYVNCKSSIYGTLAVLVQFGLGDPLPIGVV